MRIILAGLLFLCPAVTRPERLYVIADALYIRSKPDRASPPLNLIPYGTVVDARIESKDWAAVWPGFVAREFLSEYEPPAKVKSLTLRQTVFACYGQWDEELILESGNAQYVSVGNIEGGLKTLTRRTGTYSITDSGIRISLKAGTQKSQSLSDRVTERALEPEEISLMFSAKLNAFVTPSWLILAFENSIKINQKSCTGEYRSNSCPYGPSTYVMGYFCTTRPPLTIPDM